MTASPGNQTAHPISNRPSSLPDWVHVRVTGDDTAEFLQAQLTSDVSSILPGGTSPSAWCNPKGRVLAVIYLHRRAENDFDAFLPADLADGLVKRLRMFVMRSSVTLTPAETPPVGLIAPESVPETPTDGAVLDLPAHGDVPQRYIVLGGPAHEVDAATVAHWRTLDIAAGLPFVSGAVTEEFIPQSLNLDALNGVSFEKGCYPGQEIVARTFFLGRLKSRMVSGTSATDLSAGDRLFAAEKENPVGTVVDSVGANGQWAFTAVVPIALLDDENFELHLGAVDGASVQMQRPPYALPEPKRSQ